MISVRKHKSDHLFIAGHHDCAGCPVDDDTQKGYIEEAVDILKKDLKDIKVTGIFIDGDFNIKVVKEV